MSGDGRRKPAEWEREKEKEIAFRRLLKFAELTLKQSPLTFEELVLLHAETHNIRHELDDFKGLYGGK